MTKKVLSAAAKIGISLAIVAYLVWNAAQSKDNEGVNVFDNLVNQPKDWTLLALAWLVLATGIVLTFVRWWILVRALGTPCRLRDAVRIGFWGYLFNLAPLGVVGGDLVKAVMLARAHRQKQPEVVASVIVDRVIGLYVLFAFASVGILLTGFATTPDKNLRIVCRAVFVLTGVGTAGIASLWLPETIVGPIIRMIARIPRRPAAGEPIAGDPHVSPQAADAVVVLVDDGRRPLVFLDRLLADCPRPARREPLAGAALRDHSSEHCRRRVAAADGTLRVRHRIPVHARLRRPGDHQGPGACRGVDVSPDLDPQRRAGRVGLCSQPARRCGCDPRSGSGKCDAGGVAVVGRHWRAQKLRCHPSELTRATAFYRGIAPVVRERAGPAAPVVGLRPTAKRGSWSPPR